MRRALLLLLACSAPAYADTGAPAQPTGNPYDALRIEDLAATRQRPLFAPTRRPPSAAAVEAPAPEEAPVVEKAAAPEPPPFDLVGAVVGAGASYALLRDHASGKVVRLRPGDDAGGWRVGAIGIRSVALERDGRQNSLALLPSAAAPEPTPASEVAGNNPDDEPPAAPPPENAQAPRPDVTKRALSPRRRDP